MDKIKKISIEFIPHDSQRYKTAGDWVVTEEEIKISVSDSGNPNYNYLVAGHELDEVWFALKNGITQEEVDKFDEKYEADRSSGKYTSDQEPGDDPDCPVKWEHQVATVIERTKAILLGVDWQKYEYDLSTLHNSYGGTKKDISNT